jgi:serine/threonine protein kinase
VAERNTAFGKYILLERINVGGMAEVYKAKTVGVEGFEKIVAIKRILPSVAEDEEFIEMFVDEAKITSQLSHANLAQTFDLGKIDDTYYIAMEYVSGKDLRAVFERMKRRGERMPPPLCAYAMARVCEGLDYAHRKRDPNGSELNIVHRDVTPQNIVLSFEGEVKLIDFGIAKAANKITKTQAGILKGKFGYMSPEQVRGLPLDRRSDIFAAGVVLYELCTGERLFAGSSDFSVLEKVQQAKVTPPSQVEPSIPPKLERVMLKALAREPEDRYQQAADLAADLTRFLLELQPRNATRDDLTAFMKATFPDDLIREAEDTPSRRRPPPQLEAQRKSAPPAPALLPVEPRAEIIVRSKMGGPKRPPPAPLDVPDREEPPVESTKSTLTRRARWKRRIQYGIILVALGISAWAWLSMPKVGSRTLERAEQKSPAIKLDAVASEITVLSSPPGAQVWLDGVRKGVTPAFLPSIDPAARHAITVEKKCYRPWQVSIPARAGRRELAATLQLAPGVCVGQIEMSGMADLPEAAKEGATIGFLSLGSRPSANVLVDGVDIGHTTPLPAWPLKSGSHRVRLVASGRSKDFSVDIRSGETHIEIVDLMSAAQKRGGR